MTCPVPCDELPALMSESPLATKVPSKAAVSFVLLAPLYLGLLVFLTGVAMFGGPRIEASVNPVITDQAVANVTYADRKLCWEWSFTKRRDAKAVHIGFNVIDSMGEYATIYPVRRDDGIPFDGRGPKRAMGRQAINLCATMPEGVDIPWSVMGMIEYEAGWRPWRVVAESLPIVPAFTATQP